jgi:hypothetical protein
MSIASARKARTNLEAAVAAFGFLVLTPIALAAGSVASASADVSPRYSLIDSPLLPATRWGSPFSLLPIQTSSGLASRHEIRLSAMPVAHDAGLLGGDSSLRLDAPRATYRYTLMERPSWAWKVGLTSNLRDAGDLFRAGGDRMRFGALPLMHVGGEARLADRWRLSVDADGLMTPRGRTIDIGLRVNYRLSPSFSLYGGWRVSESGGDAEESYGAGVSNAANFGVRFRF